MLGYRFHHPRLQYRDWLNQNIGYQKQTWKNRLHYRHNKTKDPYDESSGSTNACIGVAHANQTSTDPIEPRKEIDDPSAADDTISPVNREGAKSSISGQEINYQTDEIASLIFSAVR